MPFSDSPQHWTRHHHDVLGRSWQVIAADGTQKQQDYRGLTVTITNHLGQSRSETQNALGGPEIVLDAAGIELGTTYSRPIVDIKVSRTGLGGVQVIKS